jgi:CRP/FNR family transcriptional regulator, dissimilatory nitrate respiration regulator
VRSPSEGTKVTQETNVSTSPMVTVDATPLFACLNAAALRTLRSRAIERHFCPDEVLFIAGSPPRGLFVILEGSVRVVRSRNGRQHVIHIEGPGGTLGEVPLYSGGGYPATAVAVTETRCAVIAKETLVTMMSDDPRLAWWLLERLSRRIRGLVERVDALATQDVAARLAAYILARTEPQHGRQIATLGGTQAALAEELGTVREVVVRNLRALQRGGVMRASGRGRYEILQVGALREVAGAES